MYHSSKDNHIQRAEYFNRRAEEICFQLTNMDVIMRELRKLEFEINYGNYGTFLLRFFEIVSRQKIFTRM